MMAKSLGEQISELANKPAVEDYDIEDTDFKNNRAESSDDEGSGDEDNDELKKAHYLKVEKSKLRKEVALDVTDAKYGGVKGSRGQLYNSEPAADESDEDIDDDSDAVSFRTDSEDEEMQEEESADESVEEGEDNDDDEQARRDRLSRLVQQETQLAMKKLSSTTQRDAMKGYAILNQTKLFDNIIDLRIKVQKALLASNSLPLTTDSWNLYMKDDNKKLLKENKKLLDKVLNQLIDFRTVFQAKDNINQDPNEDLQKKKRSFEDITTDTNSLDLKLKEYRIAVLNKWSNKISMASGKSQLSSNKFKSINQPANVQVENQLADSQRLHKRTRLNRRNVVPLNFSNDLKNGKLTKLQQPVSEENNDEDDDADIPKNYDPRKKDNMSIDTTENPYIFDDEDFYRTLLNELVEKKIANSNSTTNSITITTASKNNKLKKNIDTKASKGRKLNYSIQESIANFETPINGGYKWDDQQIDEFFAGLLGQKINFNEDESEVESEVDVEGEAIKNDDIQIFG
ncbi:hypothetical protein KAFR_0E01340 [Kazachstania africana CBS 2517]|uniref:Protein BFR2 n=1 Tax=Kazachstania africana (strain ATCC 22294 / BCRC 22015 / CBS 2517 / CECT 1963 / NBRC 1671 / NRRL Y-8276) TaxID=1071382 RepID=H2AV88_KAZAF|nr:hypothetical protein KAFR_0E01340 [Kazachstania africana CBS 2517]CCF58288.1 hypothetical protein KAFR_0E01340 [Kazachstania africana CBS 2517]